MSDVPDTTDSDTGPARRFESTVSEEDPDAVLAAMARELSSEGADAASGDETGVESAGAAGGGGANLGPLSATPSPAGSPMSARRTPLGAAGSGPSARAAPTALPSMAPGSPSKPPPIAGTEAGPGEGAQSAGVDDRTDLASGPWAELLGTEREVALGNPTGPPAPAPGLKLLISSASAKPAPVNQGPDATENPGLELDSIETIIQNLAAVPELNFDALMTEAHESEASEKYKAKVDEIRQEVEGTRIEDAVTNFVSAVSDEVLLVSSVGLDEVQAVEELQAQQTLSQVSKESEVHRRRLEDIALAKLRAQNELEAKRRVVKAMRDEVEKVMRVANRAQRERLEKAYIKAENHLLDALARRKGELKSYYGDLTLADSRFTGHEGRRFRVDWSSAPQPIEVKIANLAGLRDRVPAGKYVLVASLVDRLGGQSLRWSVLRGQEWHGATFPMDHDGRDTSVELEVGQSLRTVCPSQQATQPGMILLFELYLLQGKLAQRDHAVCWGAFPIVGQDFCVVTGKFKLPMIRGPATSSVSRHRDFQELVKSNLDNWMCNIYFEVIRRPRYKGGMKEFEVELQYTSGILGYPARAQDENDDTVAAIDNSSVDLPQGTGYDANQAPNRAFISGQLSASDVAEELKITHASEDRPGYSTEYKKIKAPSTGSIEDDPDLATVDQEQFHAANPDEGLSYIVRTEQIGTTKRFALLPHIRRRIPTVGEDGSEASLYHQSLLNPVPGAGEAAKSRSVFIWRQLLSECGLRQARSRQFWVLMALLVIVFWLRTWVHYLAQWIFLQAVDIPVTEFYLESLSVMLTYHDALLLTREVIGVVCIGVLGNIFCFGFMMTLTALWQLAFSQTSQWASLIVLAYGIETVLDPVLILIQDCIYARWRYGDGLMTGDAFKLYWHLKESGDSGASGIILTLFLDVVMMTMAVALFYVYFLRMHQNGRLLDVYVRLTATEEQFFLPDDAEISNTELTKLVGRAERWRGPKGERRKIAVHEHKIEVEGLDGKPVVERIETVRIFTLGLSGEVTPLRNFVVEGGAIRELFEPIEKMLRSYKVKDEEAEVFQARASEMLGVVRRRSTALAKLDADNSNRRSIAAYPNKQQSIPEEGFPA